MAKAENEYPELLKSIKFKIEKREKKKKPKMKVSGKRVFQLKEIKKRKI